MQRFGFSSGAVVMVACLAAAGCGGGGDNTSPTSRESSPAASGTTSTAQPDAPVAGGGSMAVCAEGHPDCNDTVVSGGEPGELPAPDDPVGRDTSADLTFVVRAGDGTPAITERLACPSDDLAERSKCNYIAEHPALFDDVAAGVACTQIYGGPERVQVKGELNGTAVRTVFSRTNGCEIARYDDAAVLWEADAPVAR